MTANTQIIDKVRKLLALAERAGTEAEASNAMARVQEIITKYNIDIDAIKGTGDVSFVQEHQEFEWNQSWIRAVYAGISKLYFCHMFYVQHGLEKQVVTLVGKPVNVQTARCVADVVIGTGKRMAKAYAQNAYQEFGMNAVSASNNFKKGFAKRIWQRCEELVREAVAGQTKDADTGRALIVGNLYQREFSAIAEYEASTIGIKKFGKGAGMRSGDAGHMSAGASAANSVNLRAAGVGKNQTHYLPKN